MLILLFAGITAGAQQVQRPQPVWWFGESVAANLNFYRGTTQVLNNALTVPTAFHKGDGVRPYASLLAEYRPAKVFGGMLNVAYDNRGAKFQTVMAPCNCPADLSTNLAFITIEPSIRIAPFSNAFYVFAGPTVSFNVSKSFTYAQDKQTDKRGDFSDIKSTLISAQAGLGYDFPVSKKTSATQMTVSPFASFLTDLGSAPRSVESLAYYTIRIGVALKFGSTKGMIKKTITNATMATEPDVAFSVRAPKVVPVSRNVKETFPLRNSVFFDMGSTAIPNRYVQLSNAQAASFAEAQLQEGQPTDITDGRSTRQLAVYHNILNIMGDRLRGNPQSAIALSGASDRNPSEGKILAENIKQYLVNVFGINPSRISTEGRDKPLIPSEQPGAVNDIVLLKQGDRRVDIESVSPELLMQVGGKTSPFLRPVQIMAVQQDPLDSHVIFNAPGAADAFKSWSVQLTDEQGATQMYGPYTTDQASVPGKTILGNNTQGNYKIIMTGITKSGNTIKKESSVSLVKAADANMEGMRFSILFDFDRSKSISAYENFLSDVVTPLIPANSTVIIHGHTDIIGEDMYNRNLSHDRAKGAQQILESALLKAGKSGVKFETFGFGEDESMSPFKNNLPEERFYNRTVIIDIITQR